MARIGSAHKSIMNAARDPFDGKPVVETLWGILEPGGGPVPSSMAEWLRLCKWMGEEGLLASCSDPLRSWAPGPVMHLVDVALEANREVVQRRAELMGRFASAARQERLHFAIIKGMASALQLYGDCSARQSGDIDLLVHPDDVPKADYVLRHLGWLQPAEAFAVRRAMAAGPVSLDGLAAAQSHYPLRSSPFLPHVTNYFLPDRGSLVSLELHDRFHLVDEGHVPALLSSAVVFEAAGLKLPTLSRPAQAALSLLSFHEDSEGVRCAVNPRQDLGLKACVDVACWLGCLDDRELASMAALLEECGAIDAAFSAAGNCGDLFAWVAEFPDALRLGQSRWTMGYRERLVHPSLAAKMATEEVVKQVGRLVGSRGDIAVETDGRWRLMPAPSSYLPSGIMFRAWPGGAGGSITICWDVPALLAGDANNLALQAVVVGDGPGSSLAIRIEVLLAEGVQSSAVEEVKVGNVDSHAGHVRGDVAERLSVMPNGKGGLKVEVEIGLDVLGSRQWRPRLAIPSAYCKITERLFRPVAGRTLVEAAEEAFNR